MKKLTKTVTLYQEKNRIIIRLFGESVNGTTLDGERDWMWKSIIPGQGVVSTGTWTSEASARRNARAWLRKYYGVCLPAKNAKVKAPAAPGARP